MGIVSSTVLRARNDEDGTIMGSSISFSKNERFQSKPLLNKVWCLPWHRAEGGGQRTKRFTTSLPKSSKTNEIIDN